MEGVYCLSNQLYLLLFFEKGLPEISWIQPVTLNYKAPETKRADWYGWWADMGFLFSYDGSITF